MKRSIKRMSYVLLAVVCLPIQDVKPVIQIGDINRPQTIINM
jgi:hypothetical protein